MTWRPICTTKTTLNDLLHEMYNRRLQEAELLTDFGIATIHLPQASEREILCGLVHYFDTHRAWCILPENHMGGHESATGFWPRSSA